jgi:hypothetical protein
MTVKPEPYTPRPSAGHLVTEIDLMNPDRVSMMEG